ncbi:MAG: glycosyltransferase family 4 protein [Bacilli bacterium]
MRLLVFTDTYVPDVNGVAWTLRRLYEHLTAKGHEVRFVAATSKEGDVPQEVSFHASGIRFPLYKDYQVAILRSKRIQTLIEEYKPDLIHVATPFSVGYAGLKIARRYGVPVVGSYHTNFDQYLESYNLSATKGLLDRYLRWFHNRLSRVFVPSRTTLEDLATRGYQNLEVWDHGVDRSLFQPVSEADASIRAQYNITRPYLCCYAGRICAEKDIETLFKIIQGVEQQWPNQVHWILAGDGPQRQEFERLELPYVTFTGFIDHSKLPVIYSASDLFVFPSYTETFGNVVLEALSCGTPVVCAAAGGPLGIVTAGETGEFCESKNAEQFITEVVALLQNDEKRNQYRENAVRYAETKTWTAIFNELERSYNEVLNNEDKVMEWRIKRRISILRNRK